MRTAKLLVLLGICACGGTKQGPRTSDLGPRPENTKPAPDPHAPELFSPAWKQAEVGKPISFSTAVIDQDLDETAVTVTKMPKSAKFDPITQTITWTPQHEDMPAGEFMLRIQQPGRGTDNTVKFSIAVVHTPTPAPAAPPQSPVIETLLLIHAPGRLEQVNKDWPLDRLLEVGAATFKLQTPPEKRAAITKVLDGKAAYEQFLTGLAQTHQNPRLDPKSPQFDKDAFGDPKSWKLVAFRPRIDKAWTELRVVYQAMKAPEPVFAMFRLRPVVEYIPALPRPEEEREANNKLFLGMVAKHLMKNGGPNPAFETDQAAEGREVSALMTDVMMFDDTKTKPYLHGFEIGIALEARMGGGSARNADGSYKSGDGWGWSAMKPFPAGDGQAYVNVAIPGFWTETVPSPDGKTWIPKCTARYADTPLCRKTMGFVDLPAMQDGKLVNGKIDANNLYIEHKQKWSVEHLALDDGRRDLGEENGMTCSQCHIRTFGMHDYSDRANVDPSAGTPKAPNHPLPTLNFQIIPGARWEAFTLEFLKHQECRGKAQLEQYLGPDAAKGLTCPLAK